MTDIMARFGLMLIAGVLLCTMATEHEDSMGALMVGVSALLIMTACPLEKGEQQ